MALYRTPLRFLVDDVTTALKQTVDDREIQPTQVGMWIITLANRLLSQHIFKRDSGAFLSIWPQVPVIEPTTTSSPDIVAGRKYIELPAAIFDFDRDGAIEYIAYESDGGPGCPPRFAKQRFERTTPTQDLWLNMNPYSKPSPRRPYYFRNNNYIGLLGIENINVKNVEVGIYSTIIPVDKIDLDAPFDFPEELMDVLRRQCLDLGRMILLTPSSTLNQGNDPVDDDVKTAPTQKIASVNPTADATQQATE